MHFKERPHYPPPRAATMDNLGPSTSSATATRESANTLDTLSTITNTIDTRSVVDTRYLRRECHLLLAIIPLANHQSLLPFNYLPRSLAAALDSAAPFNAIYLFIHSSLACSNKYTVHPPPIHPSIHPSVRPSIEPSTVTGASLEIAAHSLISRGK